MPIPLSVQPSPVHAGATVHFAYSGDPRNDAAIRAPGTICNRVFRDLEAHWPVRYYDFSDTVTPVEARPGDVVIGHPHPHPQSVVRRLFAVPGTLRFLLWPMHHRIPEIGRFVLEIAREAEALFVISGPYWTETLDRTEFAEWKERIVRLDNAVDPQRFPLLKRTFNPSGRRGLLVMGRSGPEKGARELFAQLARTDWPLFVAGHYRPEDLALLAGRTNTRLLGDISWSNPAAVSFVMRHCDFFVNLSVSDASPTTLLEAMSLGLIPVTTPQCGYFLPSFLLLSLIDPEHNLLTLRNAQDMQEHHLRIMQKQNRQAIVTTHTWEGFLAPIRTRIARAMDSLVDMTCSVGFAAHRAAPSRLQ